MLSPTLHQERAELWSSILDEIGRPDPDPHHAAARARLMHHLIDSAVPPQLYSSGSAAAALRRGGRGFFGAPTSA